MKRETFVSIFSTLMSEADDELLREAEGLVFWRKRELRQERVQQYDPGQDIVFLARDGKTKKYGTIDHLNKFSVTVKHEHPTEGYIAEVVPIERVLSPRTNTWFRDMETIEGAAEGELLEKEYSR